VPVRPRGRTLATGTTPALADRRPRGRAAGRPTWGSCWSSACAAMRGAAAATGEAARPSFPNPTGCRPRRRPLPPFAVLQSNTAAWTRAAVPEKRCRRSTRAFRGDAAGLALRCDSGSGSSRPWSRSGASRSATRRDRRPRWWRTGALCRRPGRRQKTGFFLDQRDNARASVADPGDPAPRARSLLLFGGWAAGPAEVREVTFVDQSADALRLVERGMQLNGMAPGRANCTSGRLRLPRARARRLRRGGDRPRPRQVAQAPAQGAQGLRQAEPPCLAAAEAAGVLFACSCSYHLSETDLLNLLSEAIGRDGGAATSSTRMQAQDHPCCCPCRRPAT